MRHKQKDIGLSLKEKREKLGEYTNAYMSGKIDSPEFRRAEQKYMTDYGAFVWEMGKIRLSLKGISNRLVKACFTFIDYIELITQFGQARAVGKALAKTEPRAVKAWYAADSERVFIELTNAAIMSFPYQLLQGLAKGTPEQLAEVEINSTGSALHWKSLDADLGVEQLVSGSFGSKAWMTKLKR